MPIKKGTHLTNAAVANLLREVAAVYLITKENKFKVMAYEKAADALEQLDREIRDLWQENKLDTVPGLGESIRGSLGELFKKGHSPHFDSILKKVPSAVFTLMQLPQIGPLTAYKLATQLGLRDGRHALDDLKKAAEDGKIATMAGFGHKSQEEIVASLELHKKTSTSKEATSRMPLSYAASLAEALIKYLQQAPHVGRVDVLGSLRRGVTTIGDIDIAVEAPLSHAEAIISHFVEYPKKLSVDNKGENKASIVIFPGIRVDLRVQGADSYGSMLQYFTGSKRHNIMLREYALKKGLSLSEWGIKNMKSGKITKYAAEEPFYAAVGLDYIPPQIREGTSEIELARTHQIPRLVEPADIKGDFHIHTSYDLKPSHDFGNHSYAEMMSKARQLKYSYVGFSDHNPKMSDHSASDIVQILKKRHELMKRTLSTLKMPYFIGLEVDILPSGELAIPKEGYQYVDYLLISIHSAFRVGTAAQTKRVLEALKRPKVRILGHPTGRLLQKREGYDLEWDKIFEACKTADIAMEINSWPQRLDLPDTLVREGLKRGVHYCINTDSHDKSHMDNMPYGVTVARRGWCTKYDIINTKSYADVKKWING